MSNYRGISYPWFPFKKLWKMIFCSRDMHLFDEVETADEHCLYCDACGFIVHIACFEEKEESMRRAKNGLYIDSIVFEKSENDIDYEKIIRFPKSPVPKQPWILDRIFAKKDS